MTDLTPEQIRELAEVIARMKVDPDMSGKGKVWAQSIRNHSDLAQAAGALWAYADLLERGVLLVDKDAPSILVTPDGNGGQRVQPSILGWMPNGRYIKVEGDKP